MRALSFSSLELLSACRVLFGARADFGVGFLERLHEDLVKKAFRRRAFETHPDRAGSAGLDLLVMTRRFQEVQAARELLSRYLAERGSEPLVMVRDADIPPSAPAASAEAPRAERAPRRNGHRARAGVPPRSDPPKANEYFWSGQVPGKQLRIGEYLYYCGHISLQALIAAIQAQRYQRPFFGQLAAQWGYLQLATVALLLSSKRSGERLGETALRLGALTAHQRDVVLCAQWARQRRFGRFFTDTGALSDFELVELVRAQHLHNLRLASRRAS